MEIKSQRLSLRPWRNDDLPALLAMNHESAVNALLGGEWLVKNSVHALTMYQQNFAQYGWGVFYVADHQGHFLGLTGLQPARAIMPYAPATEAVWRLRPEFWGQGFVCEALRTVLDALPAGTGLKEVLAVIALPNVRSAATAVRLGFHHDVTRDFIYPDAALDPTLRPHRIYSMRFIDPTAENSSGHVR